MIKDVIAAIQVHTPFHFLREKFLPVILAERINPEVAVNHRDLDCYPREAFSDVGEKLQEAGLRVTLHAPFLDLRPGAIDPEIRRVTVARISQVLDLAEYFQPVSIVCHAAFDTRYYFSGEEQWLSNCMETFEGLLPRLEELACPICIENVYETEPAMLSRLLDGLNSPLFRFCFDTGHHNVFAATPLAAWIETLAPHLGQLHIHDNDGQKDRHLPPGEGNFPFVELFAMLRRRCLMPVVTLETHSVDHFRKAVVALDAAGYLPFVDESRRPAHEESDLR